MQYRAYILLILTALFWGGNAVAGKLAVGHVGPFALTFLRWVFMIFLLVPFAWKHVKRDWNAIKDKLILLLGLGALGFTSFAAIMYKALEFTSAVNASIEQAAIPMMIIILNYAIFRQRATWLQVVGFSVSVIGVALTSSDGNLMNLAELKINFGDFLMLIAVLCYALYTTGLKLKPNIHWLSTVTVFSIGAILASFPLFIWEVVAQGELLVDAQGWWIILYAAIFPSVLAQIFYLWGNEMIGGNRAGLFVNLVPIFGTLLSVILLGEALHSYHILALAMVLCGIAIAEWSGHRLAKKTA